VEIRFGLTALNSPRPSVAVRDLPRVCGKPLQAG
jgi:hypothetical protein